MSNRRMPPFDLGRRRCRWAAIQILRLVSCLAIATAVAADHSTQQESASKRSLVKKWKVEDLSAAASDLSQRSRQRGREIFHEAGCVKCHVIAGQGGKYGPELTDVAKRFQGPKLLEQILKPSTEIHKEFETFVFLLDEGRIVAGLVVNKIGNQLHVLPNPLKPEEIEIIDKSSIEAWRKSDVSTMPENLLDTFTRAEILDLLAYVQSGEK